MMPQQHWTVVGAIKSARDLIEAGNALSFAVRYTGQTSDREPALCAAAAQWDAECAKQKQALRIIELEGNEPGIGAGFELAQTAVFTRQVAPDEIETAIRDRIADQIIDELAQEGLPMASLGQCDALRRALGARLTAPDGIVTALGEICRVTNPDWQEKREQAEWVTLDEVHDIATRAYFRV